MKDQREQLLASQKLKLLKSPIVGKSDETLDTYRSAPETEAVQVPIEGDNSLPDLREFGDRLGPLREIPEFQRHEDASNLELFFDLFFAANYTVFSQTSGASNAQRFEGYVGYFCLLWITWLLVGFYDVRFLTDSIFERVMRALHLGVMVGFAVVAPKFDPTNQDAQTMRSMCLILMFSRVCLAIEYGSILWHVRKFKKTHTPLWFTIYINGVAAAVYLGISFRLQSGNSRVFSTWYVVAGFEVLAAMVNSAVWEVLSFSDTHIMRRMALLTIIILGDGIIVMAEDVVNIVEGPDAWDPLTIGVLTAATALIFFVFLIYFDWMNHEHLPSWRQLLWVGFHFPFHLALVLFMQGFTQFISWSKIIDVIRTLTTETILGGPVEKVQTTQEFHDFLQNVTTSYFAIYPPSHYDTWAAVNDALQNVTKLPDSFWPQVANWTREGRNLTNIHTPNMDTLTDIMGTVELAMLNTLFQAFDIDVQNDLNEDRNVSALEQNQVEFQSRVYVESWQRYMLVFAYGYGCAGISLALMTLLSILSHTEPWGMWEIIRHIFNFLLALGMGLTAILYDYPVKAGEFLISPWVVPVLTLVWFIVLIVTHIHNPRPLFFKRSATLLIRPIKSRTIGAGAWGRPTEKPMDPAHGIDPGAPLGDEHVSTFGFQPSNIAPFYGHTDILPGSSDGQIAPVQRVYTGSRRSKLDLTTSGTAYDSRSSSAEMQR